MTKQGNSAIIKSENQPDNISDTAGVSKLPTSARPTTFASIKDQNTTQKKGSK